MDSLTHKRTHSEVDTPQYRLPDLAALSLEPRKQDHDNDYQNPGVIHDEEMPDVEDDIRVVSLPGASRY